MSRTRLLPTLAVLAICVFGGMMLVRRAVAPPPARDPRGSALLLQSVMDRVRTSYVEPVDEAKLWELATAGMVHELGDANSTLLTPDRLERLTESSSNSYRGVGLQVDVREGWITVSQPRPGSPAEKAGIQTGDRLVEIEGKSMKGWTVEEARNALRGPLGTSIRLVIERGASRLPMTLARADIRVSAVARATVLAHGVGYLAVTTFSDSTESEVATTIDSLRRAGAKKIIIDLRGNPGGLLAQGVAVADLFLSPGQRIASTRGRIAQANAVYRDETPERWPSLPVALLVNAGTASAAEIVAGALQDHDRAVVLGRVTFGKGSAQAVYPLDSGYALKLTNAWWYTPLGRSIQKRPVSEAPLADADTARPVYKTAKGRSVTGGGGIVPDILAGDSIPNAAERRFFVALGADVPVFRDIIAAEARRIIARRAVSDSLFTVNGEWRGGVRSGLRARGVDVDEATFSEASSLIDRALGNEIARQAFGVPYALRRQVRLDPIVQRAVEELSR